MTKISILPALAASLFMMTAACAEQSSVDAPVAKTDAPEAKPETMVPDTAPVSYPSIGEITYVSDAAKDILPEGTMIEKLTEDTFRWSEGPVWVQADAPYLLFTDVPGNTIYKWSEATGLETFLTPVSNGGENSPEGANGLIIAKNGGILMGDHGDRAIMHLDLETKEKTVIVDAYNGKKFNSPNDLAYGTSGAIYFSDPPYGLKGQDESVAKELDFNGVYRFKPESALGGEAKLQLVDDGLTRPNGVILTPDNRYLYVAVSDPKAAHYYRYTLDIDGMPSKRELIYDATPSVEEGQPGLPDGMAMSKEGYLFATGPGGVHVFDPEDRLIAKISTGTAAANCTFGDDGKTLYITSGPFLARLRTNVTGLGF